MKRLILSVAILAVAASCSKNEVVDIVQTNAISFSTLNDRVVSKAANDTESDYQVLAYVSSSANASAWFINEKIYGGSTDGETEDAIASGSLYYYPGEGINVTFYAYAPYDAYDASEISFDDAADPEFIYEVPGNVDLTVAASVTQDGSDDKTEVGLGFAHVLSKVSFIVVLADNLTSAFAIDDKDMKASLTVASSKGNVSLKEQEIVSTSTGNTPDTDNDAEKTYTGLLSYMIMPQDVATGTDLVISGLNIINKSTGDSQFNGKLATIDLSSEEVSLLDEYEAGIHYVYTITITSTSEGKEDDDDDEEEIFQGEITFKSTIADWNAVLIPQEDELADALGDINVYANGVEGATLTAFDVDASGITISAENASMALSLGDKSNFSVGDTITFEFGSSTYLDTLDLTITDNDNNTNYSYIPVYTADDTFITFYVAPVAASANASGLQDALSTIDTAAENATARTFYVDATVFTSEDLNSSLSLTFNSTQLVENDTITFVFADDIDTNNLSNLSFTASTTSGSALFANGGSIDGTTVTFTVTGVVSEP